MHAAYFKCFIQNEYLVMSVQVTGACNEDLYWKGLYVYVGNVAVVNMFIRQNISVKGFLRQHFPLNCMIALIILLCENFPFLI